MSRRNRGLVALLSVVVVTGCTPSVGPDPVPATSEVGQVVAVVDGDTIDVATEGGIVRVRLIGIDTPEIGRGGAVNECYAEEARTFLDELIYGQEVQLIVDATQADVDKYGRLLRHVHAGDVDAAEAAITAGAGYEYTYNTPYERQGRYRDAERAAAETGAGMWRLCEIDAVERP